MNLVIDRGNSRTKAALFEEAKLHQKFLFTSTEELKGFLSNTQVEHVLVSSVSESADAVLEWANATGKKLSLTAQLPLPIRNKYTTLATLGVDRIAAACGALELFPNRNCLVVDAGTCINYEFLDDQTTYHGGAISPGIKIRFEAMHKFTARLPLVMAVEEVPLIGSSTESCMQSGVLNGVVAEVEGIITQYANRFPNLGVILCGGDAHFFENKLKRSIFVAPDLVLTGLNRILRHHAYS